MAVNGQGSASDLDDGTDTTVTGDPRKANTLTDDSHPHPQPCRTTSWSEGSLGSGLEDNPQRVGYSTRSGYDDSDRESSYDDRSPFSPENVGPILQHTVGPHDVPVCQGTNRLISPTQSVTSTPTMKAVWAMDALESHVSIESPVP